MSKCNVHKTVHNTDWAAVNLPSIMLFFSFWRQKRKLYHLSHCLLSHWNHVTSSSQSLGGSWLPYLKHASPPSSSSLFPSPTSWPPTLPRTLPPFYLQPQHMCQCHQSWDQQNLSAISLYVWASTSVLRIWAGSLLKESFTFSVVGVFCFFFFLLSLHHFLCCFFLFLFSLFRCSFVVSLPFVAPFLSSLANGPHWWSHVLWWSLWFTFWLLLTAKISLELILLRQGVPDDFWLRSRWCAATSGIRGRILWVEITWTSGNQGTLRLFLCMLGVQLTPIYRILVKRTNFSP